MNYIVSIGFKFYRENLISDQADTVGLTEEINHNLRLTSHDIVLRRRISLDVTLDRP